MEAEKIKTPMQVLEKYTSIPQHYDVRVIKAMEEYASQFKQPPVSVMPKDFKKTLEYMIDSAEPGREGCTYGDTDFDSVSVCEGIKIGLEMALSALSKEAPKEQTTLEQRIELFEKLLGEMSTEEVKERLSKYDPEIYGDWYLEPPSKERETAIESPQKTYTREEVIKLIDEILQHPDDVIDACTNENTNWSAEDLLDIVE